MEHELQHHGILGQKWGVRRYQNKDGTLTSAGRKRYADDPEPRNIQNGDRKGVNGKKIAVGVGIGATVVAGTVLTAYLVKKYGAKNISEIADKAPAGKEVFQDLMKSAPVASTPVSKIPAPKVEPKQVLEKAIQSTPAVPVSAPKISAPRVSADKPRYEIPKTYDWETLMKQNNELLKKMYAELA